MAGRNDYGYGVSGEKEKELWTKIVDDCLKYMDQNYDTDTRVVEFKTPKEIHEVLDLSLNWESKGLDGVLQEIETVMKYSVRTGHIRFFNQLWAGTDKAAVIGELLTAVLNSSMYTYEVSPVFSLMEITLIDWLLDLAGFKNGEGVFAPGGAHSNLLAIIAARNFADPSVKQEGVKQGSNYVLFTSSQSHYTIKRAASVCGMGMDGSRSVACDAEGRLDPVALDKDITEAKAQGKIIVCVSATCGSTVYGAYDDLEAIADVCEKHGVWFHVDAAWGGHCLVSDKHRHLMKGCHRANSITWTATKCFGLPQQCSALLVSKQEALTRCNAMCEDYLFHDHEEKAFDLGERTLNCGRRVDALKLWLSLKVQGREGFAKICDHAFDQAAYLVAELEKRPESFKLAHKPQSLNVCFWFIPPSARSLPDDERQIKMGDVTAKIRRVMQLEGKVLFNYSDMAGLPGHFFRFITCNPYARTEDIDFCISEIERIGADF